MRIDRLRLPSFRNLIDFEVDFDEGSARQVVVGRNGVGKSNLLEAIVRIFRDLDLEEPSTFPYEIEYLCRGHSVRIVNATDHSKSANTVKNYKRKYELLSGSATKILGEKKYVEVSESEFFKRNRRLHSGEYGERLLPNYVFGYYSGHVARFEHLFERHEERYYADQIRGEEAPLRALFLARPHHSQFAVLSFFAADDERARDYLKKEMRIESLDAVLFSLRQPYWGKGKKNLEAGAEGRRFWAAAGRVAPFLEALFRHSFVPMAFLERLKVSVGQTETRERRFCYVPSQQGLVELAGGLSNKEFFARLESLVFSDLVNGDGSDVRLWLRLSGVAEPVTFADLAEGERQLLTVLGLLRFTAEEEALFILDEPDTHLNPAWCLDYLDNLKTYGADLASSQIIMTTHSPLTFAGLKKNEVVILERSIEGKVFAQHPTRSPRGMGFSAILASDYFGLRSQLDGKTLKLLDEKRALALKDEKSDRDRARLARLDKVLGRLDFSKSVRDPLYLEFIRAMTEAQGQTADISQPAPSSGDWRLRKEIAVEIAKRISGQDER